MLFADLDITNIYKVINLAKFVREHRAELRELNDAWDTPTTGFKDRMAGMPNGGQDALNELYPNVPEGDPFTVTELNALAYLVTTLIKSDADTMSAALDMLWKV